MIANRRPAAQPSVRSYNAADPAFCESSSYRPNSPYAASKAASDHLVRSFVATYNKEEIFRAVLYPAIAANPFFTFYTVATESGTIAFEWTGDNGFTFTESATISVA